MPHPSTFRARLRGIRRRLSSGQPPPRPADPRLGEAIRNATSYGFAYRRLRAALQGKQPSELDDVTPVAPAKEDAIADWRVARDVYRRARLFDRLQAGEPFPDAVTESVREYTRRGDPATGRALAQALLREPTTRVAGHLASAVVAAGSGLPALAWAHFREVPREDWRRAAVAEFLRAGFDQEPERAVAEVRALLADRPAELAPAAWFSVVASCFGAGRERLARDAFDLAAELAGREPARWAQLAPQLEWLRPWLASPGRPEAPAPLPAGRIGFAVLDYQNPDRAETSSNLGDYIQTLASLGHLARHRNLRFHGPADLVKVLDRLQERVRPASRIGASAAAEVTLVPVNRDASSYDPVPAGTWVVGFGWYQQSSFGRHDFPLHPNLRPIFISFHCNRLELLTPAAIEYLRRHGPIGCRDWATVDLLLGAGVPAFFSGCLTTTTRMLFSDLEPSERPAVGAPTAYVDATAADRERAAAGDVIIRHEDEQVRVTALAPNLERAADQLESYRRRYAGVVTSRLHCYLPVRSIGVPVEFHPTNPADPRFGGLAGLSGEELAGMADRIETKLAAVLKAILDGQDEPAAYARWREVCAPDVAAAQARHRAVPPIPPPSFDIAAACTAIRERSRDYPRRLPGPAGDEVHVALALDGNLKPELPVVVAAMVEHCSRPLHLWILCRDHDLADQRRLADWFPELTITWLPCDEVDYGPVLGMLKHITISTMDRLLLPDLLPELDRLVYHDIDALPVADLARLYEWDLGGTPLAARAAVAVGESSGFRNVRRSARRLRDTPEAAGDLLHRMHARHPFDFRPLNAGILVLDLARMRADNFCAEFIPYVEQYGMNDQEVLNCYVGGDRADLPPQWNALPAQEIVRDPKIIHWAGRLKPWRGEYVLLKEVWQEYARRLAGRQARAGTGSQES